MKPTARDVIKAMGRELKGGKAKKKGSKKKKKSKLPIAASPVMEIKIKWGDAYPAEGELEHAFECLRGLRRYQKEGIGLLKDYIELINEMNELVNAVQTNAIDNADFSKKAKELEDRKINLFFP